MASPVASAGFGAAAVAAGAAAVTERDKLREQYPLGAALTALKGLKALADAETSKRQIGSFQFAVMGVDFSTMECDPALAKCCDTIRKQDAVVTAILPALRKANEIFLKALKLDDSTKYMYGISLGNGVVGTFCADIYPDKSGFIELQSKGAFSKAHSQLDAIVTSSYSSEEIAAVTGGLVSYTIDIGR